MKGARSGDLARGRQCVSPNGCPIRPKGLFVPASSKRPKESVCIYADFLPINSTTPRSRTGLSW
jgi:hypothetical protein